VTVSIWLMSKYGFRSREQGIDRKRLLGLICMTRSTATSHDAGAARPFHGEIVESPQVGPKPLTW
jgi:hypothetical protein